MEFQAEDINGHIVVKPIIERKGKDLLIHVPSLSLIKKLVKQHGKRNLQ